MWAVQAVKAVLLVDTQECKSLHSHCSSTLRDSVTINMVKTGSPWVQATGKGEENMKQKGTYRRKEYAGYISQDSNRKIEPRE